MDIWIKLILLHPRNKHQGQYNFPKLIAASPELASFVKPNNYKNLSINFFDSKAVKALNKALLKVHYNIELWDLPDGYLCPPIPGRVDYIHNVADLLMTENKESSNIKAIKCLDIGTGANCIYPILGVTEYGWSFIGSDIDPKAIKSAQNIVKFNAKLNGKVELRLQKNPQFIFKQIIKSNEHFDVTICNPPFHSSAAEAQAGSRRKLNNLKNKPSSKIDLNFGGQSNELWCQGGEKEFINKMILESRQFAQHCTWFTTLVSKEINLPYFYKALKRIKVSKSETIPMKQGNKISRILAWKF